MKLILILLYLTSYYPLYAPVFDQKDREDRILVYNNYLALQARNYTLNQILHTIRMVESSNRYDAIGKSGEYGAYQFTKRSWEAYCMKFEGKVLDITIPENQDLIARKKVEWLLDKGLTIEQIASYWNSGKVTYAGRKGVNRYGVRYNTEKYVVKFIIQYNQT